MAAWTHNGLTILVELKLIFDSGMRNSAGFEYFKFQLGLMNYYPRRENSFTKSPIYGTSEYNAGTLLSCQQCFQFGR